MKRKLSVILFICCLLFLLPACESEFATSSVKTLTKPYIATYECLEARLGNEDILSKHDYIKITLLNSKELEVSFKPKNGERKAFKGNYTVDSETREFTGEIGILGFNFKETVKIEKGNFTIVKNFLSLPLIMNFKQT